MASPDEIFPLCDDLTRIPAALRNNYQFEHDLLVAQLPLRARVLQVGSMDGMRAVRLLQTRPDLQLTGLEIEEPLVAVARQNLVAAGLQAKFIAGDITNPGDLPPSDYVLCLNNTLGYIPDEERALANMKRLGKHVIVSVFGEQFTEALAQEYFASINLRLNRVEDDHFILDGFAAVRRYTRSKVASWGGTVTDTPVGYFCVIQ